ncbi:MAG: hypothetical protein H6710_09885 [Myxococcales bacterium]|nr:hypothetical protein [Myxococcales bacterium]MCB9700628.1 hypothetical protein [Myxococcales bacterium]
MTRAARVALALLVLPAAGCGASYADATFSPLCGSAAPFKLLALGEGEMLSYRGVSRVGDRYYIEIADDTHPYMTTRTYSVGLCGEDPRIVASGPLRPVYALPAWPDQPLACAGPSDVFDSELVALDPLGERAPEVVIEQGCSNAFHTEVASGLVVTWVPPDEPWYGSARYFPYSEGDGPAFLPEVGLGEVSVDWSENAVNMVAFGDDILYIRSRPSDIYVIASDLYRRSLSDLSEVMLAADATAFAATSTHLLYRRPGAVVLRDRMSGSESIIDEADVSNRCLELHEREAIVHHTAGSGECDFGGGVVVDLERGLRFEVADGRRPLRLMDDGRWLVMTRSNQALSVDLERGEERLLADEVAGSWYAFQIDDEGLVARKFPDRRGWPVALIPLDGSEAEILARRSTENFQRIADGRVVTMVEESDLVVVERGTLREHLIDHGVLEMSGGAAMVEVEPDLIAYQVVDGERRGIYLADLGAPADG